MLTKRQFAAPGGQYPGAPYAPYGLPPPAAGLPPFGADNSAMMQFGMHYGSRVIQKTQANMAKYFFTLRGLHYYFTVNNSYVKNKLRLLIFPFRHKYRRRELDATHRFEDLAEVPASSYNYLTAVDDINAPDLYIPLMAAITYTLLVGFFTGLRGGNFSPEVLIATGTSCALATAAELFLLRLTLYVLAVPKPVFALDLLCYISYKFYTASVVLLVRHVVPRLVYHPAWIAFALLHGYFLVQTLKLHWQGSTASMPASFLSLLAACQVPIYFWLQHI